MTDFQKDLMGLEMGGWLYAERRKWKIRRWVWGTILFLYFSLSVYFIIRSILNT